MAPEATPKSKGENKGRERKPRENTPTDEKKANKQMCSKDLKEGTAEAAEVGMKQGMVQDRHDKAWRTNTAKTTMCTNVDEL